MNEKRRSAGSKAEFIALAGIGPKLAAFVDSLIESPESFFSMPFEERREIENQMDVIISLFGKS